MANPNMIDWDFVFRDPTPEEIGETLTEREFARKHPIEYLTMITQNSL